MNKKAMRVGAVLVGLFTTVCGSPSETSRPTEPLVGVVVAVDSRAVGVTDARQDDSGRVVYDAVGVRISAETEIFVPEPDGSLRPGTVDDLAEGDVIRFWTTGVELRSLPPQVFATRIERIQ